MAGGGAKICELYREATGLSSVEDAVNHLQASLPREQVIDGARKLNEFIDGFKHHMMCEFSSQDSGAGELVVTKDMVDGFVRNFMDAKRLER
jgi:hypothetical protein